MILLPQVTNITSSCFKNFDNLSHQTFVRLLFDSLYFRVEGYHNANLRTVNFPKCLISQNLKQKLLSFSLDLIFYHLIDYKQIALLFTHTICPKFSKKRDINT